MKGNLVYFAGFKNHVGFYGTPKGDAAFQKALSVYKQGKGSIQFPLTQPMPLDLIARMVTFRAEENYALPPDAAEPINSNCIHSRLLGGGVLV